MINELFKIIKNTASSLEKRRIIKEAISDQKQKNLIIQIFEDCYGPTKYNIRVDSLDDAPLYIDYNIDEDYKLFHAALQMLATRELVGKRARDYIKSIIGRFNILDQQILISILNKNLKIGFTLEQLYSLTGRKKKDFECSLAFNLDKIRDVNPTDGTYFASRKLDGCRCLCFIEVERNGDNYVAHDPKFISRQNKEFTTLNNLKEPIKKLALGYHRCGKLVFDGEVCIMDENGDEHFDWIMKEIRRKNHTIKHPCYNIFDILSEDEFYGVKASEDFSVRNFYLINAFHHLKENYGEQPELKLLYQERIEKQGDFDRWSKYVTDKNWEGFMLRRDVPYRSGRTKDLLKVKKFQDAEFKVIGCETGEMKFNTETISVVTNIFINYKGRPVSVGSGITKEQRIDWYNDPKKIIGKTVTVQYFEETVDSKTGKYSLRFPVLKYVYENERID